MRSRRIEVFVRIALLGAALAIVAPAHAASAPTHRARRSARASRVAADSIFFTSVLGDWHGRSDCMQKGTACRDEITQYRFQPAPGEPDSILLDAQKLVNGKYESMGVMTFGYTAATHTWSSEFRNGRVDILWSFQIANDRLVGTCVGLPDRTPTRRVTATRGLDPRPGDSH